MKVNGIVAEYNPFHNGHKYHLERSKQKNNADYTIIAMSGNFMQRGAPAILNKYTRAEMALESGADLVLEIPSFYAICSAEYFANGAVTMLDKLGIVDTLCFGSECGNEHILGLIANILLEEPDEYKVRLKIKLRQGLSYPLARSQALLEYCPDLSTCMDVFSKSNNILGIEYIKAIRRRNSIITPTTTKRVGADYHDNRLGTFQCSALAIREAIFSNPDSTLLEEHMPSTAYTLMKNFWEGTPPINCDDFSLALHYKLLTEPNYDFSKYVDVTKDLSDRIGKNLYKFTSFRSFCELLKSKEVTYTRISRCLMHILLNMDKESLARYASLDYVPYARVLGFRKSATPLLSAIKEHSSIPLIVKLADANKVLSEDAFEMFQRDISISNIYNSAVANKSGRPMINEYSTPIIIV